MSTKNGTSSNKRAGSLRGRSCSMFLGHRHTAMLPVQTWLTKQIWVRWYTAQMTQNQRICKLSSHIPFKNLKDKKKTVLSVAECYQKHFSAALKLAWWFGFFQRDRNLSEVTQNTHIKSASSPAIRYTHALSVIANTAYFPDKHRRNLFLQCQNSEVCFTAPSPYTPFSITTKNSNILKYGY